MNILLTGTGGREHALAWKISQSPLLRKLWIAGGNAGIDLIGENANLDVGDQSAVVAFCEQNEIDLVVIGPEAPLVAGLADTLEAANITVFGPSAAAAQLEGSKSFTKALCDRMNIPTAAYGKFSSLEPSLAYVRKHGAPIVIKADGLAAGKGVTVATTLEQAEAALHDCFDGSFGDAGAEVVIEEFMEGEEASFFFLCDGKNVLPLATAQDHKRVGDGDTGPNTGGMGAYSPAPCMTNDLIERTIGQIIEPTMRGMADAGTPFKGVLYCGLMLTAQGPKLVEYNVRFGDPECQVLMMRLKSDLVPALLAAARGDLSDQMLEWSNDFAMTIVMAANGYPGSYEKGSQIKLPDLAGENGFIFHAGTKLQNGQVVANGGRVLNVTAMAQDVQTARDRAYDLVAQVKWDDGFYRSDIGWRAL